MCVCAVDSSCAHFSLSQLPPLIFSKHSYLQNSPLTKQVVLLHSFLALLQQNFLPAGVALHYWNSDSKIVLHFIFNRKTKIFNIPAQKRICSSLISSKYVHHKNLLKSRWDKNLSIMHCEDLKFALHENSVNIHAMYVINLYSWIHRISIEIQHFTHLLSLLRSF